MATRLERCLDGPWRHEPRIDLRCADWAGPDRAGPGSPCPCLRSAMGRGIRTAAADDVRLA